MSFVKRDRMPCLHYWGMARRSQDPTPQATGTVGQVQHRCQLHSKQLPACGRASRVSFLHTWSSQPSTGRGHQSEVQVGWHGGSSSSSSRDGGGFGGLMLDVVTDLCGTSLNICSATGPRTTEWVAITWKPDAVKSPQSAKPHL